MENHLKIRALLKEHFPNTYIVFNTSNNKRNLMMWELSATKLYNFEVDRMLTLEVLETQGPFADCYDFFKKVNIPSYMIEEYRENVLKFSEK